MGHLTAATEGFVQSEPGYQQHERTAYVCVITIDSKESEPVSDGVRLHEHNQVIQLLTWVLVAAA